MAVRSRLRADATRNRDRILDAAAEVFAEAGPGADIAGIARRAAVGNATVFRCFPTKDDLIATVVQRGLEEQLAAVRAAHDATDGDAHDVLSAMLESLLRGRLANRCVAEAASGQVLERPCIGAIHAEIAALVEAVLRRGRDDGSIRDDVTATDLALLVACVGRHAATRGPAVTLWQRPLALILDGVRPSDHRLPGAPPAWEQVGTTCTTPPRPGGGADLLAGSPLGG